jgi:hypothetical protein
LTPGEFKSIAIQIYGARHWKLLLSRDLGVNVSTIHRMMLRPHITASAALALRGLLEHHRQRTEKKNEVPHDATDMHIFYYAPDDGES